MNTPSTLITGATAMQGLLSLHAAANAWFTAFYVGTAAVGSISTNGTTTAYNTTSDYRLKILHGLVDGSVIDRIVIYDATFKTEPEVHRSVLLAHELQAIAPHIVTGNKDATRIVDGETVIDPQMVDYSQLIPDVIAKCQFLQAKTASLLQRVAALEAIVEGRSRPY